VFRAPLGGGGGGCCSIYSQDHPSAAGAGQVDRGWGAPPSTLLLKATMTILPVFVIHRCTHTLSVANIYITKYHIKV